MKARLIYLSLVALVFSCGTLGCNLFGNDDNDRGDAGVPEVVESQPYDGEEQVSRSPEILVTFSEAMDEGSVEDATAFGFDMMSLPFETSWQGNVYIIEPTDVLGYNTEFTVIIYNTALSATGEPMAATWTMRFTTETRWPVVVQTYPEDGATDVPTNANPWIRFNHAMDQASTEAAISIYPAVDLAFAWTEDDEVRLDIIDEFATTTTYTVTVDESAMIQGGEFNLPADYVFTFITGSGGDDSAPYIIAWDPPCGSQDVPVDLGSVSVTFSEPVNPETVEPALIDLRFLMAMQCDGPVWNDDGDAFTINLGNLPPGAELFVDLGPFEDQAGNESEDPEQWWIQTAGEPDWFPNGEQDQWEGLREEDGDRCDTYEYYFLSKVENLSDDDFDIAEYRFDRCDDPDLDQSRHFTKLADRVQLRGFGLYKWDEESEQYVWTEQWITPPADFFLLPPAEGQSWSGTCSIELGGEQGSGVLHYSAEILGFEDLEQEYYSDRSGSGSLPPFCDDVDPLHGLLPHCAILRIEHEIDVEIEVEPDVWETHTIHSGVEQLWYCSGVGMVKGDCSYTDTEPGGEPESGWFRDTIYQWSVGQ